MRGSDGAPRLPRTRGGARTAATRTAAALASGALLGGGALLGAGVDVASAAGSPLPNRTLLAAGAFSAAAGTGVAGCDDLRVGPTRKQGDGLAVTATVPQALGRVALPSEAFRVVVNGRDEVPVTAERLPTSSLAVVLVLASSPTTTPAAFDKARSAALELLVGLPADAPAAVVSASGPATVVAPISTDHEALARALASVRLQPGGDAAAAVTLARTLVPAGDRGHVAVLTDGGTPLPAGNGSVELHQIGYGAPGPNGAAGCPTPGAAVPVLAAVDAVEAELSGSYDLTFQPQDRGDLRLYLRSGDVTGVADLDQVAQPAGASPRAAAPVTPSARRGSGRGGLSLARLFLVAVAVLLLAVLLAVALLLRRRRHATAGRELTAAPFTEGRDQPSGPGDPAAVEPVADRPDSSEGPAGAPATGDNGYGDRARAVAMAGPADRDLAPTPAAPRQDAPARSTVLAAAGSLAGSVRMRISSRRASGQAYDERTPELVAAETGPRLQSPPHAVAATTTVAPLPQRDGAPEAATARQVVASPPDADVQQPARQAGGSSALTPELLATVAPAPAVAPVAPAPAIAPAAAAPVIASAAPAVAVAPAAPAPAVAPTTARTTAEPAPAAGLPPRRPGEPRLWRAASYLAAGGDVPTGRQAVAGGADEAELLAALDVAERAGAPSDGPVTAAARTAPAREAALSALAAARRTAVRWRVAVTSAVLLVAAGRVAVAPLTRPWLFALGAALAVLAAGWLWLATRPPFTAAVADGWRRRRDPAIVRQGAEQLTRAAMWSSTGLPVDEALGRTGRAPGYLVARGQSEARRRVEQGATPTRALVEVATELWQWLATPGRVFSSPHRAAAVVTAAGVLPAVVLLLLS